MGWLTITTIAVFVFGGLFSRSIVERWKDRRDAGQDRRYSTQVAAIQRNTDLATLAALPRDTAVWTNRQSLLWESIARNGVTKVTPNGHAMATRARIDSATKLLSGQRLTEALSILAGVSAPLSVDASALIASLKERARNTMAQLSALQSEEDRRQYARSYESGLLDNGINADVAVSGDRATELTMKWALVSKVTAHAMEKDVNLLGTMRSMGFTRFTITNGYDEQWHWDLTK